MDLFIQGVKHFVAVILGASSIVFPANNLPADLPSPAPIAGQVINSPGPSSNAEMITSSGSYSYAGQGVNYSFSFPKNGGYVLGSFNGLCKGGITGTFSPGNPGGISGKAKGDCKVLFVSQPIDVDFSGNVWPDQGLIKVDWEGQTGPYGHNKGNLEMHFNP